MQLCVYNVYVYIDNIIIMIIISSSSSTSIIITIVIIICIIYYIHLYRERERDIAGIGGPQRQKGRIWRLWSLVAGVDWG